MEPTTTWICDACGQLIKEANHGWVEWLVSQDKSGKRSGRGLRLVHHRLFSPNGNCQYDSHLEFSRDRACLHDLDLESFLGPDGLNILLSQIAEHTLPTEDTLEMIKRLHIPGYEHTRKHFDRAIYEEVFEPNMPKGYYSQRDIEAVLKFVESEK
jgi:hypothetical protein